MTLLLLASTSTARC